MAQKIKKLVIVMAILFGITFVDGMFSLGISDNFYSVIGLAELVVIVWLLALVLKKEKNQIGSLPNIGSQEGAKFCGNCGKSISTNTRFCSGCGSKQD